MRLSAIYPYLKEDLLRYARVQSVVVRIEGVAAVEKETLTQARGKMTRHAWHAVFVLVLPGAGAVARLHGACTQCRMLTALGNFPLLISRGAIQCKRRKFSGQSIPVSPNVFSASFSLERTSLSL